MPNTNAPAHIVEMYNRRYYVNRRIMKVLGDRLYLGVRARPERKEHFVVWKSEKDTYKVLWVDTGATWTVQILLRQLKDAKGNYYIESPIVSLYRDGREGNLGRFSGDNLTHIANGVADNILGDAFNDV